MYKVIFYQDKEDALPRSSIVEAQDKDDAVYMILSIYPKAVLVSVQHYEYS